MFDFQGMTADELLARQEELRSRAEAIETELRANAEGMDAEALSSETESNISERQAIAQELEQRRAAAQAAAEERRADFEAGGRTIERRTDKMTENRFAVNSVEYRDAWVKKMIGRTISEEERDALASAGAVIPTLTVNAVWDRLVKPAELLGRVDVSQFPSYVKFPKVTTNNPATAQAVGGTISESSDVINYIDLTPNEYVKLLTVKADINNMAVPAVHDWIVNNLVDNIRYAINKDIVIGTGTNAIKGLATSITANATALPATATKGSLLKIMAALGSAYQDGAIWIMTPGMFYEEVMGVTQLNDYIINDGFAFKLFGHDVVLMSECLIGGKETIFYGDPKAFKVNVFSPIEVKQFETATTTNLQFRGATMADGEIIDDNAFVRFAKA